MKLEIRRYRRERWQGDDAKRGVMGGTFVDLLTRDANGKNGDALFLCLCGKCRQGGTVGGQCAAVVGFDQYGIDIPIDTGKDHVGVCT